MRIQFKKQGFRELRTSAGAQSLLDEHASEIADRANAVGSTTDPEATEPYYEVEDATDNERGRRRIRPTSARAARHEAKTQALQKAL